MSKTWMVFALLAAAGVVRATGLSSLNTLKDPGFEGGGSWETHCDGASYAKLLKADQVEKGGPAGNGCGYISKAGGDSTVAALWQDVRVKAGETYLLSGMARGEGTLFLYFYDARGKYLGQEGGVRVNCAEWVSIGTRVTVMPKATRARVRFEIYGQGKTGEGWIDEVYWGPVPPRPSQVRGLAAKAGDGVALSWQPVKDRKVIRYEVYRSRYPDYQVGAAQPLMGVKGTSWKDRTVPADWECCFYQVAAVNDVNLQGEPSEAVKVVLRKDGARSPLVWTTSPMEKVRRYQERPVTASAVEQRVSLKLARNEAEAVQIMVGAQAQPIRKLDVSLSGFGGKLRGSLYRVHYTRVRKPTIAPQVNRPGLYADALPPWRGAVEVPEYANQGIWLQLVSAVDCPVGTQSGVVTVTGDGKVLARIAVQAEVWDFTVPVTPTFETAFAVWPGFVAKPFGVKDGTAEFRRLYETYYWFMTERRMPPDDIPVPLTSSEAARFLDDPRVNSFRIPVSADKVDVPALKKVADHLRKNGWLDKAYVYCLDEPTPAQYANCRKVAAQVHAAGKDIRFLLTEQPEKELKGSVDIWAPILHNVKWKDYDEALKAGEEYWWYTCIYPQEPYPTYLIDDIGISHRVLSWLQAKHKIQGVLYWSVNICAKYRNSAYQPEVEVWEEAEMFPTANGDGFLTYPGKQVGIDGPVTSIRLELIRDGNEDVEYVNLLRDLLKKNGCQDVEKEIAAYIQPVARTFQDWERNPQVLENQRIRLARRILQEMKK